MCRLDQVGCACLCVCPHFLRTDSVEILQAGFGSHGAFSNNSIIGFAACEIRVNDQAQKKGIWGSTHVDKLF